MWLSKGNGISPGKSLVTNSNPESILSEEYRAVRTNIHFLKNGRKNLIFLVSSPGRKEGKSTAVSNIAVSMAQQKERILLIDGNLRNPALHQIFNVSNATGLTDVLTDHMDLSDAVNRTGNMHLDVLTCGDIPVDPAELLESVNMKQLLVTARNTYDTILIDAPSVLEVTDTKVLASYCDGVILVIKEDQTKTKDAIESKKVLEFAKAPLVGVIMSQ